MFEIRYTKLANLDIKRIRYYLENVLFNYKASEYFFKGINEKTQKLKDFPYIGIVYLDYQNRYLIYKNFYIFYQIQEKEKIIYIKRIVHKNEVVL